jgi:hypothetical protein
MCPELLALGLERSYISIFREKKDWCRYKYGIIMSAAPEPEMEEVRRQKHIQK